MELNKTKKWFYGLTAVAVLFILALGGWWLFLVFKLAHKLEAMHIPELSGNLLYMIQWEGLTFVAMLFILGAALLYIFIQDHRKTQAISSFFASMTHELKTPLASIRLQAQVISDLIADLNAGLNEDLSNETNKKQAYSNRQLEKYVQRLNQDTVRLENELDRSLQLSRLEKGGVLNLHAISLSDYILHLTKQHKEIFFDLHGNLEHEDYMIQADEFALKMVLRNLIENTLKHNPKVDQDKKIFISIASKGKKVILQYYDNGAPFSGDLQKLGQLFYKHNSPKGSGIGLYLIKKLTTKMNGSFKISNQDKLVFTLEFMQATDSNKRCES